MHPPEVMVSRVREATGVLEAEGKREGGVTGVAEITEKVTVVEVEVADQQVAVAAWKGASRYPYVGMLRNVG